VLNSKHYLNRLDCNELKISVYGFPKRRAQILLLEILEVPVGVTSGRTCLQGSLVLLVLLVVCVKPLGQSVQIPDKLLLILSYYY